MATISVQSILKEGQFVLSDLGDDTAVLTSLTNSKIISLNQLGTRIISTLLEPGDQEEAQLISKLIVDVCDNYGISASQAESDVETFLSEFKLNIGTET